MGKREEGEVLGVPSLRRYGGIDMGRCMKNFAYLCTLCVLDYEF